LRAYFDSGFLFKLYWREANTAAAQTIVQQSELPLALSRFKELEMVHVARRKTWLTGPTGPPLLSADQFQAGLNLFEQDLANGILTHLQVDYDEVFDAALGLPRKHGQTIPIETAGLLPIFWSQGTGSNVIKLTASPVVSGVLTCVLMELAARLRKVGFTESGFVPPAGANPGSYE